MSIMIGYVLLITFVIFMGVIIYNWMKGYVPQEDLNCPDDVSLFIKDYDCSTTQLNLTLKNNGKFQVGGYFIRATNSPQQGLAIIDLSFNITTGETVLTPTGVKINNSLDPAQEVTHKFDISHVTPLVYSIEIIPLRWQEQNRRKRMVICKDAKIREDLICG